MCPFFHDALWGACELSEPVLVDLMETEPVQRLKGISQAGASYYLFPDKKQHTRFDHSVGVMLLLALLDAPVEEQVAGLLHDIPHTAFSHTVDIVFPSEEHDYHERFQMQIVENSRIPEILRDHGVSLRAAMQPDDFPLLEQKLPDLCADRIDYALRDLLRIGKITAQEAASFREHLVTTSAPVALDDAGIALWFGLLFSEANDTLWAGPDEAGAYWALAGAIRHALSTGDFTEDDLFTTDSLAMQRLYSSGDEIVQAFLRLPTPGNHFYTVTGPGPYFTTHMKLRTVDPLVQEPGWDKPKRLSSISAEYATHLATRPPGPQIHYRLWCANIGHVLFDFLGRTGEPGLQP